ncbi:IclR family transcriptional regulator [Azospirillum sp. RWY-5-1]|uniref:IclR family transcriptional regulator n=1 Tax=Azospirillum oleiclasticum TaxID=2735135 RepID=A0ABX2T9Z0_9PROT|nr:IclR family transcriptional regulator [Azospirillum oleiclasticum]NYZ13954.1 IclR family transcriptional regulator [Azospirillum oleiclasticum]NYZ20877.1 IclR family transcriptional regulator [Azospirillum oleiclasticum]
MQTKNVKSAGKLLAVLECFSSLDRRLSVAEIARRTALPRSTAHRLILALKEIGFLEQDRSRDEYRLGMKLFELGSIVLFNMDLQREAKPFVEALASLTREAVHLCVFDGSRMVFVERSSGGRTGQNNATITMETTPCHCTGVGKVALAFQPDAVIDRVIGFGLPAYTRNTITDPTRLKEELAATRARGFALDFGEIEPGRNCVAAPIRNTGGQVFAAISVSGSSTRLRPETLEQLAPILTSHAESISLRLGYNPDEARPVTGKARGRRTARRKDEETAPSGAA